VFGARLRLILGARVRIAGSLVIFLLAAAPAAAAQTPPPGTILTFGGPPLSLYGVNPVTGQRMHLSDLTNPVEGPTLGSYRVAGGPGGAVVATGLSTAPGAQDQGLLVRIDPATGQRTVVSDFSNPAQGPVGYTPFGVAVESKSVFLVTDRGQGGGGNGAALWRVNDGMRTKLSDFNNSAQGPLGSSPEGVALDPSGQIYVADAEGGSQCNLPNAADFCGALFRVDGTTGQRTVVSDFGNSLQGPTGEDPVGLAVDPTDGTILVIDEFAGVCGCGELFRVDPATHTRTLLSDFGNASQGPVNGARPKAVVVAQDGTILTDGCPGASGHGAICQINRTNGIRTNFGDFGDGNLGPVAGGPLGTLTFMPVVPTLRSTTTSLSCNPAAVNTGQTTTCTATVTDNGGGSATTPTGTVSFSSSVKEALPYGFFSGSSCPLKPSGPSGVSDCSLHYKPKSFGSLTISASYPGDDTHAASGDSKSIQARRVPHTTITSGPSGPTASAPHFTYISDVPGSTFQCRFDRAPLRICSPDGIVRFDLPYGPHTFHVYAIGPDGTKDPIGDGRAFNLGPLTRGFSCSLDANIEVPRGAVLGEAECDVYGSCPAYSRCVVPTLGVGTTDMGRGVGWVDFSACRIPLPGGEELRLCNVIADLHDVVCYFPSAAGGFTDQCPTKQNFNTDYEAPVTRFGAPCILYQEYNMPGSGQVTCTVTLQITPVSMLALVGGAGGGAGVFVPGAGGLALKPAGALLAADASMAGKRRRPLFAPVQVTVRRLGWATFNLKLSRATKAALRRHHRLRLRVQLTFTPRHGRRVVRTEQLTLTRAPTCFVVVPPKSSRGHRHRHYTLPKPQPCPATQ
jgi:hypothetical protein